MRVFVAGTETGVGKTHATAALAIALRKAGAEVRARKPVQSFDPTEGPTDAEILARATGEEPELVCPPTRWYELPLAPPIAAETLGRPRILIEDLVRETALPDAGVTLVEGVGGPRSPLAHDGDSATLARALGCERVILVAHSGLGTINAVLLGLPHFAPLRTDVYFNRYEVTSATHRTNRGWLKDKEGIDVIVEIDALADRLIAATADARAVKL